MFGRLLLVLSAILSFSCSSASLMRPDCHSCTVEEQEWTGFSWNALVGKWKGSVENMKNNETSAKKQKVDKPAELSFVKAESFLQAWGSDCKGLPKEALVLNGVLWDGGLGPKEYEAFIPVEGNKVAYGRISFSQLNGKGTCLFRRLGRVMGKNRLNLPAVSFSDRAITGARAPASANDHQDISVEFLRFAPMDPATRSFSSDGRKPSSVKDQERPPLILRVFRVTSHSSEKFSDRGEWRGTEEFIYRLWRVSWQ